MRDTFPILMVWNYFSGNPCPSSHHCVDGSCISWSKTCTQTAFCRDWTNTPSVCGKSGLVLYVSQKKPNLNALVCIYKDLPEHHSCNQTKFICFVMSEHWSMKMASCVALARTDRFIQRLRFVCICSFGCRCWKMSP